MVHDLNESIRAKVEEAEKIPVSWNRARVFENIAANAEPKVKASFFYYAAAVLLLLLMAGLWVYQSQEQRTAERILALEQAIEKKSVEAGKVSIEEGKALVSEIVAVGIACKEGAQVATIPDEVVTIVPTVKKEEELRNESLLIEPLEVKGEKVETAVSVTNEVTPEISTAVAEQSTTKRTVAPVIGYIPVEVEHHPTVVRKVKQKRSITDLFLTPKETTSTPRDDSHSFTARIN